MISVVELTGFELDKHSFPAVTSLPVKSRELRVLTRSCD